jgi:hypothetical protein
VVKRKLAVALQESKEDGTVSLCTDLQGVSK